MHWSTLIDSLSSAWGKSWNIKPPSIALHPDISYNKKIIKFTVGIKRKEELWDTKNEQEKNITNDFKRSFTQTHVRWVCTHVDTFVVYIRPTESLFFLTHSTAKRKEKENHIEFNVKFQQENDNDEKKNLNGPKISLYFQAYYCCCRKK